jgi:hypothetical protein
MNRLKTNTVYEAKDYIVFLPDPGSFRYLCSGNHQLLKEQGTANPPHVLQKQQLAYELH